MYFIFQKTSFVDDMLYMISPPSPTSHGFYIVPSPPILLNLAKKSLYLSLGRKQPHSRAVGHTSPHMTGRRSKGLCGRMDSDLPCCPDFLVVSFDMKGEAGPWSAKQVDRVAKTSWL